jgi:hypothetical protein
VAQDPAHISLVLQIAEPHFTAIFSPTNKLQLTDFFVIAAQ